MRRHDQDFLGPCPWRVNGKPCRRVEGHDGDHVQANGPKKPAKVRSPRPPLGTSCAICGDDTRLLVWDHDHVNGKERGYLCSSCNSGLGFFKDNPALLIAAADYLMPSRPAGLRLKARG